ncbi:MAG: hypothetical protein M1814_005331 [Vezdaea aestivalis]|nr:MAG: hypothetical protein M1814_005331 [Vezdaea aestivalis]
MSDFETILNHTQEMQAYDLPAVVDSSETFDDWMHWGQSGSGTPEIDEELPFIDLDSPFVSSNLSSSGLNLPFIFEDLFFDPVCRSFDSNVSLINENFTSSDTNTPMSLVTPQARRPQPRKDYTERLRFTPEEDAKLIELKNKRLQWAAIAAEFPGRTVGTLQVRYSTKLKCRDTAYHGLAV